MLNKFAANSGLIRCDSLAPGVHYSTYLILIYGLRARLIDSVVSDFNVVDPLLNFSVIFVLCPR